ncbi:MAG TPA: hypothetical protein VJ770_20170 [Stellaceae bacterium]|nr:hypothetical protein [Stellaceae bacterium]
MYDADTLSGISTLGHSAHEKLNGSAYEKIVDHICNMPWSMITNRELLQIAHAYYYFSIQFRENLEIACHLYPSDEDLKALYAEECHTDNLSPWPCVAEIGEKLDHDEFMRRSLSLQPVDRADHLRRAGISYLETVHRVDRPTRAKSIASYEDGGLSRVFRAILRAPCWEGAALQAFQFFLEQHILFDSASDQGHGTLCRHLAPDDSILPLWAAFRDMLTTAVPRLARGPSPT